ncbi:MAG: hypothetical protein ACYSRP_05225 [Planctomycetota bacterium]|jgi:hypothetical protein
MHIDTITWIAISGPIIASISLGWHIWNIVRDKAKITIKCRHDMKPFGVLATIYDPNKTYLSTKIINKGRRPVKISQAGLKSKGTTYWSVSADCFYPLLDRTLTEENPSTNFMIQQEGLDLGNIDFVWAVDATEKMYKEKYKKAVKTG